LALPRVKRIAFCASHGGTLGHSEALSKQKEGCRLQAGGWSLIQSVRTFS
jgi:hypothetical protein